MEKLAYIGPEYTFSHDLARAKYKNFEYVPCEELEDVVAAVAGGDCQIGLLPFYNTTRRAIEESQRALIRHIGNVHVVDLIPFDVQHYLCSYEKSLEDLDAVWSKNVVEHQVSRWMRVALPNATFIGKSSTAAAMKELSETKTPKVGAIGTFSSASHYGVPVLLENIQNVPNVTLFFTIRNGQFDVDGKDHLLICWPQFEADVHRSVGKSVADMGCQVSTNWKLRMNDGGSPEAYFVEISSPFSTLDLHASFASLQQNFPGAQVLGGYAGNSITRLIWSESKSK